MTGWMVLLVTLAVLFLLSRVRLGGLVRYGSGEGLLARLILGPVRLTLYPPREKPEKKEKPAKKKRKKPKKEPPEGEKKAEGHKRTLPPIPELLALAAEAAGALKRRIRVDTVTIRLVWAAADPMETALGFGRANAVMGMIWPLIENNFKVKHHDLDVSVDFDRKEPEIFGEMALTMTVGQLLSFGIRFGVKLLVIWSRSGRHSANNQEA